MKRYIIQLLAILLVVGLLTACGDRQTLEGKENTEQSGTAAPAQAEPPAETGETPEAEEAAQAPEPAEAPETQAEEIPAQEPADGADETPDQDPVTGEEEGEADWEEDDTEVFDQGAGDDSGYHYVVNPGNDYFLAADVDMEPLVQSPYVFRQLHREPIDYAPEWAQEHGFALPPVPGLEAVYTVGPYLYQIEEEGEELQMLSIYDAQTYDMVGSYDLYDYRNPPDENIEPGLEYIAKVSIRYAEIRDGILYVQMGHRTYAESQPHTAFLLAIDPTDGRLLWRSSEQIANGDHFLILDDVIICGYGFTAEDDFMYVVDRANGSILDIYELDSAPDYFLREGDQLYVLTYKSAYEFRIDDREQ